MKVVILAGSFGQRLAKQIREQGPKGPHANLALGDPPGLAVGLLPVRGICRGFGEVLRSGSMC